MRRLILLHNAHKVIIAAYVATHVLDYIEYRTVINRIHA